MFARSESGPFAYYSKLLSRWILQTWQLKYHSYHTESDVSGHAFKSKSNQLDAVERKVISFSKNKRKLHQYIKPHQPKKIHLSIFICVFINNMSIRKSFFANVFLFATFITSCVAQSNTTTTTLCVPFYCKGDLLIGMAQWFGSNKLLSEEIQMQIFLTTVIYLFFGKCADVVMVIKYLVGVVILIAVVVWQYKRRNMNTWNDGLENNRASSNEQNC